MCFFFPNFHRSGCPLVPFAADAPGLASNLYSQQWSALGGSHALSQVNFPQLFLLPWSSLWDGWVAKDHLT